MKANGVLNVRWSNWGHENPRDTMGRTERCLSILITIPTHSFYRYRYWNQRRNKTFPEPGWESGIFSGLSALCPERLGNLFSAPPNKLPRLLGLSWGFNKEKDFFHLSLLPPSQAYSVALKSIALRVGSGRLTFLRAAEESWKRSVMSACLSIHSPICWAVTLLLRWVEERCPLNAALSFNKVLRQLSRTSFRQHF